ncbi:ribosomal protein S18 acetylase RimI-like enzyme [Pedobacter sp. UYEF25]
MENIKLEKVLPHEITQLQQFSWITFSETFSEFNSKENMQKAFDTDFSMVQITKEFNNENSQFYFAKEKESVIGYLKLNCGEAQSELQEVDGMEIERIYVLKKYLGKSIGQLLYEKARSVAQDLKLHYLWLGVWEKNERAIHFYQKNGFAEFKKHAFMLGDDKQTDLMMRLEIKMEDPNLLQK